MRYRPFLRLATVLTLTLFAAGVLLPTNADTRSFDRFKPPDPPEQDLGPVVLLGAALLVGIILLASTGDDNGNNSKPTPYDPSRERKQGTNATDSAADPPAEGADSTATSPDAAECSRLSLYLDVQPTEQFGVTDHLLSSSCELKIGVSVRF